MWPQLKRLLLTRLRLRESWIIFFILGIIMMNYPFLTIFNKPITVGGIPLLYFYLMAGWAASICVIWIFAKALTSPDETAGPEDRS